MIDWSGRDYAEVSNLQRAMATEALTTLRFGHDDRVLDIGCGDGYLTPAVAGMVPDGFAVGVDASPRMIATAHAGGEQARCIGCPSDREWDFGSREQFERWCAVGSGAWTDRLPPQDRAQFIADLVRAYEPIAGRRGLFRFTQMRSLLRKSH